MVMLLPPWQPASRASPIKASARATARRKLLPLPFGFALLNCRPIKESFFAQANAFEIVIRIIGIHLGHAQAGARDTLLNPRRKQPNELNNKTTGECQRTSPARIEAESGAPRTNSSPCPL